MRLAPANPGGRAFSEDNGTTKNFCSQNTRNFCRVKIDFTGAGGSRGTATFVDEGTLISQTYRNVTTVVEQRWQVDPLAQTFTLESNCQIGGVDLWFTKKGTTDVLVQIREITACFPNRRVAERRWQAETGGITLPDGTHLLTTREDQAVITGAVTRAMLKPDTTIDFKTASGAWVSVDAARMIASGLTVSEHVEHCFSRERALHEAIDKAGQGQHNWRGRSLRAYPAHHRLPRRHS